MNVKMKKVVKSLDPESVVQFIRVLAELNAAGLTEGQYEFLEASADMFPDAVHGVLAQAEKAYEALKKTL